MNLPSNIQEMLAEHENINFRFGKDTEDFPYGHNIAGVWYSLLIWEDGFPKYYGFSSSKTSKQELIETLKALLEQGTRHTLIGIWTGEWTTFLFVLDSDIAIEEIAWRQKLSAKELAESENLRERRLERKKAERETTRSPRKSTPKVTQDMSDFNDFEGLLRGLNDGLDEETS
jgi:hypothetical protein